MKLTPRKRRMTFHFATREEAAELEKKLERDGIPFERQHDDADFQPFKVLTGRSV